MTVSHIVNIIHPPAVICGVGAVARIRPWLEERGVERILVVSDAVMAGRVPDLLGDAVGRATVFDRVEPEPTTTNFADLLDVACQCRPDCVIGFGGGSSLDLAKLAAVLWNSDQTLEEIVGPDRVGGRTTALVQVPTTAGTGSEGGFRSLVTDAETHQKLAVQSMFLLADMAVVDPQLTATMPPKLTAATGVDALAHCVESYTNKNAHPAVDLYALEGMRLVGRYLERAVRDGGDLEARTGMSLASMYGGFCLGPVNTAGGHAVAYPLGTRYAMPHGIANALIFPYVLAFNAPACPEKTANVLDALGVQTNSAPTEEETFRIAADFCDKVGIEVDFDAYGISDSDLEAMAEESFAIRRLLDNNPRELARDDILSMYRCLVGRNR